MKEEPPVQSAEVALHNGDVRYWRKADMHRTRRLLVRQRTMLSNALRGHLAELGIVSAKGRNGISQLLGIITDVTDNRVAPTVRNLLDVLARQYSALSAEIRSIDKSILTWHRSCEASRRPEQIPGIGPIVATALVAEIGDWKEFRSGRNLAAWIGLVPKQHTTGSKDKLGSITKQGNRYLRWLLVTGARSVIRYAKKTRDRTRPMLRQRQKVLAKAPSTRDPKQTYQQRDQWDRVACYRQSRS